MKRSLPLAALLLTLAAPVASLDLAEMTDEERALFRDEVRAYLIENPEVIVEALTILEDRQAASEAENDIALVQQHAAALFENPADWVGGNPEGDITVVEFMDYRCGYCKKAHDEVASLISGDSNIRLILKEFPILGEQSDLASRFAIAVRLLGGDDSYKAAHDRLMSMRADVSDQSLQQLAAELGLDPAKVAAQMSAPEVEAVIASNRALGNAMRINGTPTFVIDNTMLRGYVPLENMRQIVAEARG